MSQYHRSILEPFTHAYNISSQKVDKKKTEKRNEVTFLLIQQVVNALQWRFKNQMYYVWGGSVMVNVVPPRALPPFTPADHHKYRVSDESTKPHIFELGA